MTNKQQAAQEEQRDGNAVRKPDTDTQPLERVLLEIQQDSLRKPQRYLDQVRVQFGGE
jgi:hypothetical protein